jgi:hypothetical protein
MQNVQLKCNCAAWSSLLHDHKCIGNRSGILTMFGAVCTQPVKGILSRFLCRPTFTFVTQDLILLLCPRNSIYQPLFILNYVIKADCKMNFQFTFYKDFHLYSHVSHVVPTAWHVLGLRMEERPPAMEVSCEYIE